MLNFYLHKIGGHLQELAVLAMVFVPLDAHNLTRREILFLYVGSAAMLLAGIEMDRRTH
jgi:hypothetical protein